MCVISFERSPTIVYTRKCGGYISVIIVFCRMPKGLLCRNIVVYTLGANVMCHKQKFIEIYFVYVFLYMCWVLGIGEKQHFQCCCSSNKLYGNIFRSLVLLLFNRP